MPASGADALRVLLSVALGLGLAAACGFRVFVPLLIAALAARFGHLPLAAGFDWLSGTPALVALGTATVLEVGAYYIPWLDHALDAVATPAAVGAGMLAAASTVTELPPVARWGVSIVGGGAVAGMVQGASVLLRLKSTALTGGLANPVLATVELIGATGLALVAIVLPLLAVALLVALVVVATRTTGRLLFGRGRPASSGQRADVGMRGAALLAGSLLLTARPSGGTPMSLGLTSPAFTHGGPIPADFTCEGANRSPALAWTGVPSGARSLALVVDDPDAPDPAAPKMIFVHWVLYDIDPGARGLAEGVGTRDLPAGTREGMTDFKRTGWGGPCPPIGRHRYFFRLYALDTPLPHLGRPTRAALDRAMAGHVLAQAELMGTYQKRPR